MRASRSQYIALAITAAATVAYFWMRRKNKTQTSNTTERFNYSQYGERISRGYRNNNPLNVRYSTSNPWKGKVLPNTDDGNQFEQFTSTPYGYRAAFVTMRNYGKNYGLYTIKEIISRYAPSNENNTANYINRVCEYSGLKPDTYMGANDKSKWLKLAYAMSIVENDVPKYRTLLQQLGLPNMDAIQDGWNLL